MCQARRQPHTATRASTNHRRHGVPVPATAQPKPMATSASPQVTSTTETRPTARATRAVTTIATAAIATESRANPHQGVSGARPDAQDLVDPHPALAEREHPADEVEPPDADHLLADEGGELRQVCLEALPPPGD